MYSIPESFYNLAALFQKLPGIGRKNAEKYAEKLLDKEDLEMWIQTLTQAKSGFSTCPRCFLLKEGDTCLNCSLPEDAIKPTALCVVQKLHDAEAISRSGFFSGCFHLFAYNLHPYTSSKALEKGIQSLIKHIEEYSFKEILFAFDATLSSETTCILLKERLTSLNIPLFRIGFGASPSQGLNQNDSQALGCAILHKIPF